MTANAKTLSALLFTSAYILWGYGNSFLPRDDSALSWGVDLAINFAFVAALALLHQTGTLRYGDYGGSLPGRVSELLSDTVFCLILFAVIVLLLQEPLSRLASGFGIAAGEGRSGASILNSGASAFSTMTLAVMLVIASTLEEVVYRGMLWRLLQRKGVFFLVSVPAFAGIHYSEGSTAVAVAALFGLAACWLFLHFRTLAPLILGHIGVNLSVLLIRT